METADIKNNVWHYKNVRKVHVELSSKCNAACPGCQRFISKSPIVNPNLIQTNITLEQFENWFPPEFVSQVTDWLFCGNYGDPLAANDIYEILEYICDNSISRIRINTNGGLRTPDLYTKIGKLFAKTNYDSAITFSIDGLEDTNHIYRRNVIWQKVWENLMAYVDTGATTYWDFLKFKHNAHQIDEAQEIASKYNINLLVKNPFGVDKTAMPAYNTNLELEYVIESATSEQNYEPYIPAPPDYVAPMPAKITSSGTIDCLSVHKKTGKIERTFTEIYVDSLGRVLPCCFIPGGLLVTYFDWGMQLQEIQKKMGNDNNLHFNSLEKILDSGVLEVYSRSWQDKEIAACWIYCGKTSEKSRVIDTLYRETI